MNKLTKQAIVVGILASGVAGLAQANDDGDGCSLSTLRGLYLFNASGFNVVAGVAVPKALVTFVRFNGDGTLTGGVSTTSINGVITRNPGGFTGTYTVTADCTGSADFGPPPHFTFDLFISSKGAELVMIQTGGPVPAVMQGTAERLSR